MHSLHILVDTSTEGRDASPNRSHLVARFLDALVLDNPLPLERVAEARHAAGAFLDALDVLLQGERTAGGNAIVLQGSTLERVVDALLGRSLEVADVEAAREGMDRFLCAVDVLLQERTADGDAIIVHPGTSAAKDATTLADDAIRLGGRVLDALFQGTTPWGAVVAGARCLLLGREIDMGHRVGRVRDVMLYENDARVNMLAEAAEGALWVMETVQRAPVEQKHIDSVLARLREVVRFGPAPIAPAARVARAIESFAADRPVSRETRDALRVLAEGYRSSAHAGSVVAFFSPTRDKGTDPRVNQETTVFCSEHTVVLEHPSDTEVRTTDEGHLVVSWVRPGLDRLLFDWFREIVPEFAQVVTRLVSERETALANALGEAIDGWAAAAGEPTPEAIARLRAVLDGAS